jgi:two-component system CheB/CheR fusion protein
MRILAVEDEPEYLEMLQDVMKSLGHTITLAAGGEEALAILDRQPVDVIISDVSMPGMDGLKFHTLVRGREAYRNTPFIFLTGVDDLTEIRAASRGDCDLLLQKPFPVESLLKMFSGKLRPRK